MVRRKKREYRRFRFKNTPGRSYQWYAGRPPEHLHHKLKQGHLTSISNGITMFGLPGGAIMMSAKTMSANLNSYGVF